jgi:Hemolysins and related proteins containing CBS domains
VTEIVLFLLAAALRAFFALARSALINMRRPRLVELEQKGVTSARAIQQLTEQSGQLLATAEVGALLGLVFSAGLAVLGFVPPAGRPGQGVGWHIAHNRDVRRDRLCDSDAGCRALPVCLWPADP